jgi:uncharacterized UBP type Zn finger protein
MIPQGFKNFGNTCFISSIFNCLFHIETMFQMVSFEDIRKDDNISLFNCFASVMRDYSEGKNTMKQLERFINTLYKNSSQFQKHQQCDAHEFLIFLLDQIKQAFENIAITPELLQSLTMLNNCFINVQSTIQCKRNHLTQSNVVPEILTLYLSNHSDLESCIDSYFKPDFIDDYNCLKCHTMTLAKRTVRIINFPDVLILHLQLIINVSIFLTEFFPWVFVIFFFVDFKREKNKIVNFMI